MAAPHTGGSRSVATAAKMAALHIGEPIMGSRRPGGSLLKRRERRFPDAPLRTGLSPMVGGSGSVNFVSRNSSRHERNEICYNVCR